LAKSSEIIFVIALQCNYCSAINKARAEPGNETRKINMTADIVANYFHIFDNILYTFS
jgi:hypothetical protein